MGTSEYEIGQPVIVNEHGRTYDGEIVSVGRTQLGITYGGRSRVTKFRMDTQRTVGTEVGVGISFTTAEQAERKQHEARIRKVLTNGGIELSNRRRFTLEQIEALAEVVKNWKD